MADRDVFRARRKRYDKVRHRIRLRKLRETIDWDIEADRRRILGYLYDLIPKWRGRLPRLRRTFRREEIDWLLAESVKSAKTKLQQRLLVDSVVRTGYKDEPTIDRNGKPSSRRTTALHHVPRSSRYLCRRLFKIYDRFDVNYTDELGLTHFQVACEQGLDDIVEKFLEHGQDPNCLLPDTGDPPMQLTHSCCFLHKGEIMSGNDQGRQRVGPYESVYSRPLHLALKYGHRSLAELLLRRGADVNLADKDGSTLLHILCKEDDHHNLAAMLFQFSDVTRWPIRVDAQDKLGNAPLHYAAKARNKESIELLLTANADPNSANKEGMTPLHIICQADYDDDDLAQVYIDICDEVSQHELQIDARDKKGRTPLQWAVTSLKPDMVDLLLDRGADLSNFVFPTYSHFAEGLKLLKMTERSKTEDLDKAILATGILAMVEHLEEEEP